jgi:hypothetical protein
MSSHTVKNVVFYQCTVVKLLNLLTMAKNIVTLLQCLNVGLVEYDTTLVKILCLW